MPVIPIPLVSNNKIALAFCASFWYTWFPVFLHVAVPGDTWVGGFLALTTAMILQGLLFMTFMFLGFIWELGNAS